MSVRVLDVDDDPLQVVQDLNAAFDGTTVTDLKAASAVNATNATNVTTNINGHAITDIFESNGATVKNATSSIKTNGIAETGTSQLIIHKKVIEIGSWNMVVSSNKNVTHGISSGTILNVTAIIFHDIGGPTQRLDNSSGSSISWTDTSINLSRQSVSIFDSSDYDSTVINRGFIVIEYID